MEKIEKIFDLLENWRQLPKYQLERRIDIFFALYLPEILGKEDVIKHENIFPEFPLKKYDDDNKGSSTNADYAIFVNKNGKVKLKLIELKTDMNSIDDDQIAYYKKAKKDGFNKILNDIIKIQKKSPQWDKYDALLSKIQINGHGTIKSTPIKKNAKRMNWEVNESDIDDEVEVIYIVPKEHDKIKWTDKIITFKDIIQKLKGKENDLIAQQLVELLEKI